MTTQVHWLSAAIAEVTDRPNTCARPVPLIFDVAFATGFGWLGTGLFVGVGRKLQRNFRKAKPHKRTVAV